MSKNVITKESVVNVARTVSRGKSGNVVNESSENVLAVNSFVTEPAVVGVSVGITLNLGNYETARLDVSIRIPCYKEEVDDAFLYAQRWCEERVEEEKKAVVAWKNGKSGKDSNPL